MKLKEVISEDLAKINIEKGFESILGKIPFISKLDPMILAFVKAGIVILLTMGFAVLIKNYLFKIYKKFLRTKTEFDNAVLKALKKPVLTLVWIFGLTFAVQIINNQLKFKLLYHVESLRRITLILCIAWFFLGFIERYKNKFIKKHEISGKTFDQATLDAIAKISKATVIISVILFLMSEFGISLSGVLAFGGISGIAIGFAAKDLLSNFFGAMMIYLDKPFKKGDWIKSPDREIEGIVDKIGWRQTKITTFERHPIYIPNSAFSTIVVENKTRMRGRRIKEIVGLRYDDINKIEKITEEIKQMLSDHEEIDKNQVILVAFNEFDDYSLNLLIYVFTKTIDWEEYHKIKQDILLKIADIIEENGAEIAFPTSKVKVSPTSIKPFTPGLSEEQ